MSEDRGTTIRCDRYECNATVFEADAAGARSRADRLGWTRTECGRDFCRLCTEIRNKRKSPVEIAPEGLRLFEVFDAAEAAGWERRDYDEEAGMAHFFCCGQEVEVASIIGMPYYAKCRECGTAIADIFAPHVGRGSVVMADPDKVDTEDPVCGLPNYQGICPHCRGDRDAYERELVPPFPTTRPQEADDDRG